eukprot:TRINITY_DN2576_c0_g1_i2.p1 TRINITY_DN2576_c0_g1~~TRINITY_DN2576_c0_g1_i2.p1  ORF type:complete len:199 (-),score=56.47 TRINITY_DN2576_c0_g1_i2:178-774(-)
MKRRSIEWIRARQIRLYTFPKSSNSSSNVSTRTVLNWCRNNIEAHLNPPQLIPQEAPKPINIPVASIKEAPSLPSSSPVNPSPATASSLISMEKSSSLLDDKVDEQMIDKLIDEAMGPNVWEQDPEKQNTIDSIEGEFESELGTEFPKSPPIINNALLENNSIVQDNDESTAQPNSKDELVINLRKDIDENEEIDIID